jgi:hypothetical protein
MRHVLRFASLIPLLGAASVATAQQEILHYKLNANCGAKVINYAAASPAPAEGTLNSTLPGGPSAAWAPGVFGGSGLAGATFGSGQFNWVDTGWSPGTVTGSLSYACWMKVHGTQPAPSLCYVFGVPISFGFRLFTGTSGLLFTASFQGTSASQSVTSRTNVWNLASQGWVHVALVIDATALTGTYYINGVAETPTTINSGCNFPATSFYVGRQTNTTNFNVFDLDEFFLVNRALTPAEISLLAQSPRAADGVFGAGGCGGLTLSSSGGTPALGNAAYGLVLNSTNPQAYSMGFGTNRCRLGPVVLPFDLGAVLPYLAGCLLESPMNIFAIGGAKQGGQATVPLPIPNDASLQGGTLYVQVVSSDLAQNRVVVSNAFALSLGH